MRQKAKQAEEAIAAATKKWKLSEIEKNKKHKEDEDE